MAVGGEDACMPQATADSRMVDPRLEAEQTDYPLGQLFPLKLTLDFREN